ncbi:Fc.00g114020.m01.CDS01 [Cosmosporella sp. VM-42]
MAAPSSITIGIELEFMVAQYQHERVRQSDQDDRWACDPPPRNRLSNVQSSDPAPFADSACILKVCETMAADGFPVGCFHALEPHRQNPITSNAPSDSVIQVQGQRCLRVWNKESEPSQESASSRFDYWIVVREGHITHELAFKPIRTTPKGFNWFATEINSPIFLGTAEFDQGLPKLRQILASLRENLKIWMNSKCGLHIHVGDGGKELNLDVAKRVVSLVYLLEKPLLFDLCHSTRRTSSHAAMISTESRIAKEQWPGLTELEGEGAELVKKLRDLQQCLKSRPQATSKNINAIHRIWAEPTISSLRAALRKHNHAGGPSSRCALNISEFNTIEFRYPEATFDTDLINRWALLVRHIFAIAMREPSKFADVLERVYEMITRNSPPGWAAQLAAIGFNVHCDSWRDRMNKYKYELHDLDAQPILPKVEVATGTQGSWM